MKVFELAKEMGTDSISLLNKLKTVGIVVKNHMSALSDEQVMKARSELAEKPVIKKPTRTKTAIRKTVAVPPSETSSRAASTAATGATKVLSRKAAGSASASATAKTADADAKKASTVLVRKRRADSGLGTTSEQLGSSADIKTALSDTTHSSLDRQTIAEQAIESYPAEQVESESPEITAADETPSSPVTPQKKSILSTGLGFLRRGSTETPPQEPASPPLSPKERPSKEQASADSSKTVEMAVPARIKEKNVVDVATLEKRSFLKVVQATAQSALRTISRPDARGTSSNQDSDKNKDKTDKKNFKPAKITKLDRAGLDKMVEEEAARKRGAGGGAGVSTRERTLNPEDVRFRDYRKKEMVFLPKKKKIPVGRELGRTQITKAADHKRVVEVNEIISVNNLAQQLNVRSVEIVKKLFTMGQQVTINDSLDIDTATLIANEYDFEVKNIAFKEEEYLTPSAKSNTDEGSDLISRPAVVTIMGHVDHGKTSLLDAIRDANVAAGEAGGITQHIGAYTVEKDGKKITFIDTPGHEAFTSMRARGASVTDIVVLVVAADDGVMPQTRESVSHAKAAKVPIIVAVNKMDKPGANPDRIKQALSEFELLAEDWGGETQFVMVSALKKTGLDELLKSINVQSEMLELKANPKPLPSGVVLEGKMEKGRGAVVSVLVQRGTLKKGNYLVADKSVCRIKAMVDQYGRMVDEVTPGNAVEILGFDLVPPAGEPFSAVDDESSAKKVVSNRMDKERAAKAASKKLSLEDLFAKAEAGDVKELKIVLKADVFGSVEAIRDSLIKLSNEKIKVDVILAAPGGITESDVLLASASNAIIVGFNIRPETNARRAAEASGIEVKCYNIIYELLDDVKKAMVGRLEKKKVEKFLGRAEVRQLFSIPKIGMIAGSSVVDGKITRSANVRLLRESVILYDGKLSSLRRFKDDAKEVSSGHECGIGLVDYNDIKMGDIIEAYDIELVQQQL